MRGITGEIGIMTEQTTTTGTRNTSRKLSDLLISLGVTRNFLTLVELLDALPDMQKTPYNVTRSLYQAVSGKSRPSICARPEGGIIMERCGPGAKNRAKSPCISATALTR
jgi:hypothetical protein